MNEFWTTCRCGAHYPADLKACPECGRPPFKIPARLIVLCAVLFAAALTTWESFDRLNLRIAESLLIAQESQEKVVSARTIEAVRRTVPDVAKWSAWINYGLINLGSGQWRVFVGLESPDKKRVHEYRVVIRDRDWEILKIEQTVGQSLASDTSARLR